MLKRNFMEQRRMRSLVYISEARTPPQWNGLIFAHAPYQTHTTIKTSCPLQQFLSMLRQYLSILLATIVAATMVNAGCCRLPDGCGNSSPADCASAGGSYSEADCTPQC
ncbi:hypothetical protein CB0940_03898 [Cercospora beticola]|uniref:Uncharacterized protein n=1 Tax=Cercospora beticola TaxID=122368 RepID=A0A2G5HKT6_CERBT|nr:hypothetical protein CB0940_03898 [Cercospora beticola]PIA92823.1 hypothetical protein CB0940_03898 [Cercospora beticola]